MNRCLAACLCPALFMASCTVLHAQPAEPAGPDAETADAADAPASRWVVPEDIRGASGRAYVVYVEAMPGDTLDDRIRNALTRAFSGGMAAEVILPHGHHTITKPIQVWRMRKNRRDDTTAEGIELADIRAVFASVKGGRRQDLPRGIVLRGATAGSTRLIWGGGPNQVMIDLPAPWHVTVRDLQIDGANTPGLIGIRYRAGWEFEANGGKKNLFERISIERIDVGVHVGGSFGPDLVGSTFRQISVHAARIGFRLESANVAEMWFHQCFLGTCEEAGFKLIGHSGRVLRSIEERDTPTDENVVLDADGREIFLEQLPPTLVKQKVRRSEHPDVPGSARRAWVGGGAPTCYISDLVAHMSDPRAWMIDSNWAPVRLEHVRMEGCSGAIRVSGKGMANIRFNDILIDVNAVTTGNIGGYAIEYHKAGPIHFLGGTFEGPVGLGQGTICYSMGARFHNRQRRMAGYAPAAYQPPEGSFFALTDKRRTVPYRRWAGAVLESGVHDTIGFVQLPGTSGARIYELQADHSLTQRVPAGATSAAVPLTGMNRPVGTTYQVSVTPTWNAGAVWVSRKRNDGFTVNFANPAPNGATIDVLVKQPVSHGLQRPEPESE